MLSIRMANRVISECNTTLIINIDNCSSNLRKIKLFKQYVKPAKTIYSVLTKEVVTVGCFFEDQKTESLAMSKINSLTKQQSSRS